MKKSSPVLNVQESNRISAFSNTKHDLQDINLKFSDIYINSDKDELLNKTNKSVTIKNDSEKKLKLG